MQDALLTYGELGLGSRLKRLSDLMMREIHVVYDTCNIEFDPYLFPVFNIIIEHQQVTTTTIQEALQYTQPAITQAIKKLSSKKLISHKVDKQDKRKKLFQLTKKGIALHHELIPLWQIIDQQVKWLTEGSANSLTSHLNFFENQLQKKSLSNRILEEYSKLKKQNENN
ncbi:MarR family winged helix-turn-helix transcriptional regulator [Aquimarina brevivitae]|uniref:Winged helix DNA-binding protein n=1 Tax=Aquimarina brevivitae TaxID=323412 RepID=A0A4Q7PF27_9FLAO|nr:winged helix DNA-binding protein [Aquimarina brevivitae]RZS98915.1 winged helix DNA-binding protein [Aquimarina brevivitae]